MRTAELLDVTDEELTETYRRIAGNVVLSTSAIQQELQRESCDSWSTTEFT